MIVNERQLAFRAIPAAPVVGARGLALGRNLVQLAQGTLAAWRLAATDRPAAVLVTGGYVSVPVALAARLRHIPLVVFLPDVRPGRAVALIARLADRIAVSSEAAARFFPAERTVVTGYPVREAVRHAERGAARRRLGIAGEAPVLLVFGGSQGARRLNQAVATGAARLLESTTLVHVSGPREHDAALAARAALPEKLQARYRLFPYLHDADMAAALAAADLVLCRAGAATLGELPARGLPSILVPLPIAGGHQSDNAHVLVDAGAAILVDDAALNGDRLVAEVAALLGDPATLAAMGAAAKSLDRPDAARAIWRVLAAAGAAGASGAGKAAAT